jgi:hypothetical protein
LLIFSLIVRISGAEISDERGSKEPVKAMHMNLGVEDLATMAEKTMKRILILGGSFAGLNAAYELKHMLKREDAEITVIARQKEFVFIPSLIWVVPG